MSGAPLTIRAYTPEDAASLWGMLEPVFRGGETYTVDPDISREEALAYWCGGERCVFMACDGEEPLGSYYIVRNQKGGGSHVCNAGFVTAPAAQGRGVARTMLDHAQASARASGFRAMQFNFVVASNTRAVTTWERAGFDIVGRLPQAFHHPRAGYVDALVMMKRL